MTTFEKWDKAFREQNMFAFNGKREGILWLKTRAVCRGKQIKSFTEKYDITLDSKTLSQQNIELYQKLCQRNDAMSILDNFMRQRNNEWYVSMNVDESKLRQDLCRIRNYEWGGDRNNSLDKYLVSRYVKAVSNYDELERKQGDIALNTWKYVQTSWYNNWTSYLIESLFKRHKNVVSAVGETKSVDFFINDVPLDLKVTFFPHVYLENEVKQKLGKREITWIRQAANKVGISVGRDLSEKQQKYILLEKLSDMGHDDIVRKVNTVRKDVITEAMQDSGKLIKWLYEKQGEMRFGSENRIYLVLVDTTNIEESWKMKRKFELIEPRVNDYLSSFNANTLKQIDFKFNNKTYKSLADIIFIIK